LHRWLALSVLLAALAAPLASHGQDAGVHAVRARVERPPEGSLRRGALPVPGWVVLAGGATLAVAAAGALLLRSSRKR
jgi:hypothetical protein